MIWLPIECLSEWLLLSQATVTVTAIAAAVAAEIATAIAIVAAAVIAVAKLLVTFSSASLVVSFFSTMHPRKSNDTFL